MFYEPGTVERIACGQPVCTQQTAALFCEPWAFHEMKSWTPS